MSEEKKVNLASHPTTEDNAMWHLQLHDNEAGGYALLPGSPERTLQFKKIWDKDSFKENAYFREFKSVSGKYKGEDIFATSTAAAASEQSLQYTSSMKSACIPYGGVRPFGL